MLLDDDNEVGKGTCRSLKIFITNAVNDDNFILGMVFSETPVMYNKIALVLTPQLEVVFT